MAQVGYIRVSSHGQNTDRQLAGVPLDKVFEERASARSVDGRPVLKACLDWLRDGDTLHVHSIDRLARSLGDLEATVKTLAAKGVSVRFHKEGLVFGAAQDSPMATLTLQLLGAVAQFERSLITERRLEGMALARQRGVKVGASPKLTPAQVAAVRERVANGAQKKALAAELGVSRQTLYAALKREQ